MSIIKAVVKGNEFAKMALDETAAKSSTTFDSSSSFEALLFSSLALHHQGYDLEFQTYDRIVLEICKANFIS